MSDYVKFLKYCQEYGLDYLIEQSENNIFVGQFNLLDNFYCLNIIHCFNSKGNCIGTKLPQLKIHRTEILKRRLEKIFNEI